MRSPVDAYEAERASGSAASIRPTATASWSRTPGESTVVPSGRRTTGTIGANNPGKTDLEKYSLLPLAKNLKGKLLLVHGVEDSNVLYQDTVRVYRELL